MPGAPADIAVWSPTTDPNRSDLRLVTKPQVAGGPEARPAGHPGQPATRLLGRDGLQDVDPASAPGGADGGDRAHGGGDDEVDQERHDRHLQLGDALLDERPTQRDPG